MRRSVTLLFAAALALAMAGDAGALTPCEDALQEAEKSYALGLFEDVPGILAPCFEEPMTRSVAVNVHSLLARAYVNADEPEKARKEIATLLRIYPAYEPEAGSSARFAALVAGVRAEEQTPQVASVSKTSESLREAPATVVVITAEEIRRRGYLDLEQLLHDLPGFDISRTNGAFYSTIYQRGYNGRFMEDAGGEEEEEEGLGGDVAETANDRNLLLVDGVEQNDLSFGTVFLSRQYPLSNIDRVEVIYGPASTMYGANAYTGVISIITKTPEAILGAGKRFAVTGQVTGGGHGAGSADFTLAGKDGSGTIAWSLTGSFEKSEEPDLEGLRYWDYTYGNVDYASLTRLDGTPEEREALCETPSPYIHCDASGISLTEEGVALVRQLDRGLVQDNGLGFDDRASNRSLSGTLRISNLTVGFQSWRSQEGLISAYGSNFAGTTNWTPSELALYLKYSIPVGVMKVNVFSRYVQTSLERDDSQLGRLHLYANRSLGLWSLVPPCASPNDPKPVGCAPAKPWLETTNFGLFSSQLRGEIDLIWESQKASAVGGVEFAKSSVQSQYDQVSAGPGELSALPLEAPQQNEHTDVAVYGQGSYRLRPSLKFVLAGRLTHNAIENKPGVSGFGALFTPRAAVVYMPSRQLVLKAIYSEAFKDPTDAQKFGVFNRDLNAFRSNGLEPEKVKNIELSAGWERADGLALQASLYQATYSDVVAYGYPRLPDGSPVPEEDCVHGCQQWQNRNSLRVRGLQMTGQYRYRDSDLWANYTRTDSVQTAPDDFFGDPLLDEDGEPVKTVPVAGIARHRANIGIGHAWSDRLRTDLHAGYVGPRRVGEGTTLPFPDIVADAYTTVNGAMTFDDVFPGATLQLIAFNLFDKTYYAPATDALNVPRVRQAGRTVHLRLSYRLSKR